MYCVFDYTVCNNYVLEITTQLNIISCDPVIMVTAVKASLALVV